MMLGIAFLILSVITGLMWFYKKSKYIKLFKYISIISFLTGVGLSGHPSVIGFVFAITSVICGVIFGIYLTKYKGVKSTISVSILFSGFLFWLSSVIILMQPDFHLFGMMGHLTAIHKLFILPLAFFAPLMFGCAISNSSAKKYKLNNWWYKKLVWILRTLLVCMGVLFFLTESILIFILISVVVLMLGIFAGHQKLKMEDWDNIKNGLWLCSMFLFGIISQLWIFTALAIVLWNNTMKQNFGSELKKLVSLK